MRPSRGRTEAPASARQGEITSPKRDDYSDAAEPRQLSEAAAERVRRGESWLSAWLSDCGITEARIAIRSGIKIKRLHAIIARPASLTAHERHRLALAFGTSPEFLTGIRPYRWRFTLFGRVAGPWRATKAIAREDAVDSGDTHRDEKGQTYDGPGVAFEYEGGEA